MSAETSGKDVVVITGGTRGIGLLLAEHFLLSGSSVAVCGREIPAGSVSLESLRQRFGVRFLTEQCNVADSADVSRFSSRVSTELGGPRVVIANAAVLGPVGKIEDINLVDFKRSLEVNVFGVMNTFKAFYPYVIKTGQGRFLTLSGGGLGGPNPMDRAAAYVASKAAVVTLVESLAPDLISFGATINAVAPGRVPTSFMSSVLDSSLDSVGPQLLEDARGRSGEVDISMIPELIELLDFLVSECGQAITGRLLSAKWETPARLKQLAFDSSERNLFRLRRIDRDLYTDLA